MNKQKKFHTFTLTSLLGISLLSIAHADGVFWSAAQSTHQSENIVQSKTHRIIFTQKEAVPVNLSYIDTKGQRVEMTHTIWFKEDLKKGNPKEVDFIGVDSTGRIKFFVQAQNLQKKMAINAKDDMYCSSRFTMTVSVTTLTPKDNYTLFGPNMQGQICKYVPKK